MATEPHIGIMIGTVVTVIVMLVIYGIDWKKLKK
jgi:hypothetical protein